METHQKVGLSICAVVAAFAIGAVTYAIGKTVGRAEGEARQVLLYIPKSQECPRYPINIIRGDGESSGLVWEPDEEIYQSSSSLDRRACVYTTEASEGRR